jgi:hypothetical protein
MHSDIMKDLRSDRGVQLTTDGHAAYLKPVENDFGCERTQYI